MQGDTLAKNEHLQGTSDSESPNLSLIALLDRREQLFAERERHGARMDDSPPEPPAEKPEEHQASSMPQDILPTDIASGDAPAFAVKNRKAPIEDFVSQQMATFDTEWKALAEGKEAERLKDMEWHPDTLPQSEGHVEGTTATGEPTTLEPSRDEETLSPTPHAEPPPVVISEQELAQQVEHRVQESEGTEAEQSAARVLRIAMMLEAWEAVSARFDHVPDTARMDAEQQVRRFEEFYAAVQAEALHRTEVIQEVALETTVKMEEGQLIAEQNARAAQDHSLAAQQTTEAAFTNITSQEVQDDQQLSENLNRERTAAYADLTIREVGEERQRITIEHQRKEAADAASDDTNRPPQNN